MDNFIEDADQITFKTGEALFTKGTETKGTYLITQGHVFLYAGTIILYY